jgi:hypothetical protein
MILEDRGLNQEDQIVISDRVEEGADQTRVTLFLREASSLSVITRVVRSSDSEKVAGI